MARVSSLERKPTLEGYTVFVRTVMNISTEDLPEDSMWIAFSYDVAVEIVNLAILAAMPTMYTLAVYNLAGDTLVNYAPDVAGKATFADMRSKWAILSFIPGVIQSSGDEGTNSSYVVQEAAKDYTLANIQQLKTPWGRQYLQIAQSTGTNWGLT